MQSSRRTCLLYTSGITKTAGALMLNLGNITDARIESMKRSARTAAKEGIPVLLDLVGVSCSKIRMELAMELIEKGKIQILKGNISDVYKRQFISREEARSSR